MHSFRHQLVSTKETIHVLDQNLVLQIHHGSNEESPIE